MVTAKSQSVDGERVPRVSVCLPVYNGQAYLAGAIESILGQSYTDFELILCDNASTDRTAEICQHYARLDGRVRYHRNDHNLGAAPNFNKGYELARGEFVRWAAYDDVLRPDYLKACIEALDADPRAVLAHTRTLVIDHLGREIPIGPEANDSVWWDGDLLRRRDLYDPPRDLMVENLDARLTTFLLKTGWCFEIFGVMRVSALRRSPLHLSFYGSDKVLLAALVIQGTFIELPEALFLRRYHQNQSSNQAHEAEATWMDTSAGTVKLRLPAQAQTMFSLLRVINRAGLSPMDRLRGYRTVGRWLMWLVGLMWRQRRQRGLFYRIRRMLFGGAGCTAKSSVGGSQELPTGENSSIWSKDNERFIDSGHSRQYGVGYGVSGGRSPAATVSILRDTTTPHVR